jgi:hypothetical protein
MTAEKIDPAAVLTFLEAKIAALQAVANSWKKALELGALGPSRFPRLPDGAAEKTNSQPIEEPVDLPVGLLSSKSLPDAIKLYLGAVRKKQTNKEIEAGLKEGGVETTAQNFSSSVAGALFRLRKSGDVLRFKDGWGLSGHYPEHLRAKLSQDNKQAPKKKTRKGKQAKHQVGVPELPIAQHAEGLEQRIETVLKADHSKVYLPKEIDEILHTGRSGVVATALGRMASKHKAEKVPGGKYRAYSGGKVQEIPKTG